MQPRRLLVIRHARAGQAASDASRPLTDQGVHHAEALGAWLDAHELRPDAALVSSALRAVQTWEALARGGGWDVAPEVSEALFAAEPESALDLVRETGDTARTLALVGHNPTMGSLAQLLDDGEGDAAAGAELASGGFPPGAVAGFEHEGGWADLSWGSARLVAYHS